MTRQEQHSDVFDDEAVFFAKKGILLCCVDSGVDKGGQGWLSSPNGLKDHPCEKMKSGQCDYL